MGSLAPPDHYAKPQGFPVSLSVKDPTEAGRNFNELGQDVEVTVPIQKTFGRHASAWWPTASKSLG
jgi:PhnB protein